MMWLMLGIGVIVGIVLVFGVAYGIDAYRTIRYRFWEQRHLKFRPTVPRDVVVFQVEICAKQWRAVAYDRNGTSLDWDLDDHPMDAMLNVLNDLGKRTHGED